MITSEQVLAAFQSIAPDVMSQSPEEVLTAADVDPQALTGLAKVLVNMFMAQSVPPEAAVEATLIIGFLIGMRTTATE